MKNKKVEKEVKTNEVIEDTNMRLILLGRESKEARVLKPGESKELMAFWNFK